MFDIPIHHYAVIDFKNFESLIDIIAPGGIEIEVEKEPEHYKEDRKISGRDNFIQEDWK